MVVIVVMIVMWTCHVDVVHTRALFGVGTNMDCRAVLPPKHQAGRDSRRENLCQRDSKRVNKTTPGASSSGQLETPRASSSGDLLQQKIRQVTRKFIFIQILMENIHQEVRWSCTEFQAAERGGARLLQSGTAGVQFFLDILPFSRCPAQRCDSQPIYGRLLVVFILACKGSRRLQKDGNE